MKWNPARINCKAMACLIIFCMLLVLTGGCGENEKNESKDTVATVNGEEIGKDELYELLLSQYGQQTLDMLITQKIIELEAGKQNIEATDEDIQKEMEKYYQYYGGQEIFMQTLAMNGYSIEDVKKDVSLNVKINKLLEPRITITEEEIKTYFEENKAIFAQEKQLKVSHILVKTEEKAQEVKDKLDKGEDFAKLAEEYSQDLLTKNSGGDLGFYGKDKMASQFGEDLFALKAGEISNPVKSQDGYHLIIVKEIKEAKDADYEESKSKITDILFDEIAQEEYYPWLEELHEQYEIENFLAVE